MEEGRCARSRGKFSGLQIDSASFFRRPSWRTMTIKRRGFMKWAFGAAASLDAQPQPNSGLKRIANTKPRNIIFILTDDHRYDAFGFLNGQAWLETPHLDSLALDGIHFRYACVTTSLCSPSRASILTGRYAHQHGIVDNNTAIPAGTRFFP